MTANHGVTELKAILDHYNDVLSEDDKSTALGEWCDYKALLNANPNLREMSIEQVFWLLSCFCFVCWNRHLKRVGVLLPI